jgi:hypothetical protein
MIARLFLILLCGGVGSLFGRLAWTGYRSGKVRPRWSGPLLDRELNPRLYWITTSAHSFVALVLFSCVVALVLGYGPVSN